MILRKTDENSDAFLAHIRQTIAVLKPNKGVKFKTTKGTLGVYFSKKHNHFSISLDGYFIEEVANPEAAAASVLSLYDGGNTDFSPFND
ncbi:MAG: hypothetical protein U5L45_18440 [Saprospiraceae bacterium]|nr:hypothetical protein [Saprospiraceae bacterium]